jgi:hypothetical protein
MAYADKNNLIADYIPDAKSASEIAAVGRILDNVSVFVDTYCKRLPGYFNPSPDDPTERRVRGEGKHFLRIPYHVFGSIEQVTLLGQVVDPATYYESDKNGWLYYENTGLHLERTFAEDCREWRWYEDQVYKVTARYGYAETPLDLQEAVRQTVERIWKTQRGVLGEVNPSGFVIERTMPPFAKDVLDRYKKRPFEI